MCSLGVFMSALSALFEAGTGWLGTIPSLSPCRALQVAALLERAGAHNARAVAEAEEALALKVWSGKGERVI